MQENRNNTKEKSGEKLFDFHVHTSGISKCSILDYKTLCAEMKKDGCDGFVLTNHFAPKHCDKPFEVWVENYKKEYFLTKEEGARSGLEVLFGIEVTLGGKGVKDLLLYGVEPDCIARSPEPLWALSLEELSEFTHRNGGVLIHAHPYRNGSTPEDPRYIDGVEVNCHPLYLKNRQAEVTAYAKEHGLIVTCGSDYHGDVYKAHCGVYLPGWVKTEKQLGAYLKSGQPRLLIHEIDESRVRTPIPTG